MTSDASQTLETSRDVSVLLDSMARVAIESHLLRLTERTVQTDEHLLLFDTEKPADSLTRLPPLKASLHLRGKSEEREASHSEQYSEQGDSVALRLSAQEQAEAHWEGRQSKEQTAQGAKYTDALLGTLGALTGLVMACVIIYVIIKFKPKEE